MSIINRIKELMKDKGIKQKDLANVLSVNPSIISAWFTRGTNPNAEYIMDIARFFDVPVEYILNGEYNYEDKKLNEEQIKILELSYNVPENELNKIIGRMEYIVENLNDN